MGTVCAKSKTIEAIRSVNFFHISLFTWLVGYWRDQRRGGRGARGETEKATSLQHSHRSQSLEDISKYSEANSANSVLSLQGLIYKKKVAVCLAGVKQTVLSLWQGGNKAEQPFVTWVILLLWGCFSLSHRWCCRRVRLGFQRNWGAAALRLHWLLCQTQMLLLVYKVRFWSCYDGNNVPGFSLADASIASSASVGSSSPVCAFPYDDIKKKRLGNFETATATL